MTGTLKERMSRIANLIGAISFGILVSRYASNFPRIHIFIFFSGKDTNNLSISKFVN